MILSRKMISASISGSLFAALLGIINPNPFGEPIVSIQDYLFSVVSILPIYMLYSFPAILIYGVLTSMVSDKIGELISSKIRIEKVELILSGILHIMFGLILFPVSLGASILFFITDQILRKRNHNDNWLEAIKSLSLPITVWFLCIWVVWIKESLFPDG